MDNTKHRRLQELDRSDFEIIKDEPDIRGWDVRNASGQKLGEVEELIIDAQQKKVRYMVVELDDDELDLEDDKKVLIPIGLAQLDKDEDDVLLPSVTAAQLQALPSYDRDRLDDETERQICAALGRQQSSPASGATTTTQSQNETQQRDTTTQAALQTNDNPENNTNIAIGSAEYYANFYGHGFFDDENLYRSRMGTAQNTGAQPESEYERGLRLWELRSDGGIIPTDESNQNPYHGELNDEKRLEMVRNRRKLYEDRRGQKHHGDPHVKKDKTIIQRIKDEGLQEGGR